MHLYLKPLLNLFDDPPREDGIGKCIGTINTHLGAGLGLALLANKIGKSFTLIYAPCKEDHDRGGRGKSLDTWAQATLDGQDRLLQIEIKNWSVTAPGVLRLPVNTEQTPQQIQAHRKKQWEYYFHNFNDGKTHIPAANSINKLLRRMVLPPHFTGEDRKQITPLLILWPTMHPEGKSEALFPVKLPDPKICEERVQNFGGFTQFWFFSMSAHIRTLHQQNISAINVDEAILRSPKQAVEKLNIDIATWLKRFFNGR